MQLNLITSVSTVIRMCNEMRQVHYNNFKLKNANRVFYTLFSNLKHLQERVSLKN